MGTTSPVILSQTLNMKSMILIAVFLAVAAAAPQDSRPIAILKQSQNHDTEKQEYFQLRGRERHLRQRERSPEADRRQARRIWNRLPGHILLPRRQRDLHHHLGRR